MIRNVVCLTVFLVVISCALPLPAQQAQAGIITCNFIFTSGANNTYLRYCVSGYGNILTIQTPFGHVHIGGGGEGYGLCQESPAVEYHNYGIDDTGNWASPVVSSTSTSVKIVRSTLDGNWTLTQTITQAAKTSSITIVMALTNHQAVGKVAYLLRYAGVEADGQAANTLGATHNGAFAWSMSPANTIPPFYGLQLQNVGTPPFGFWQGYAQTVPTGPNACAFAFNDSGGYFLGTGSLVMAYVGAVPAHGTKTITLTYRGL